MANLNYCHEAVWSNNLVSGDNSARWEELSKMGLNFLISFQILLISLNVQLRIQPPYVENTQCNTKYTQQSD